MKKPKLLILIAVITGLCGIALSFNPDLRLVGALLSLSSLVAIVVIRLTCFRCKKCNGYQGRDPGNNCKQCGAPL